MDLSHAAWRKSIRSSQNGSCVEVTTVTDGRQKPRHAVAVRDSKNPGGPVLALASEQWRAFTGQIKTGMFDLG
jgi:hypothetical protein